MEVKVEKFLIEIFCWEKGSESLRLFVIETEKFSKNLGKKKVGRSKFEWIPWSMTARILAWKVSKKRNLRRKVWFWGWTFAQWLNNFWKGKFVVGRKLGRGNYGIHNVNFSVIFLVICMQQMISMSQKFYLS